MAAVVAVAAASAIAGKRYEDTFRGGCHRKVAAPFYFWRFGIAGNRKPWTQLINPLGVIVGVVRAGFSERLHGRRGTVEDLFDKVAKRRGL